jgi:hypothetical protein
VETLPSAAISVLLYTQFFTGCQLVP